MMLGHDIQLPQQTCESGGIGQKSPYPSFRDPPTICGIVAMHRMGNMPGLKCALSAAVVRADIDDPKFVDRDTVCKPGSGNQWWSSHDSHPYKVSVQDPTTQELTTSTT
jgi:hypothetical protein